LNGDDLRKLARIREQVLMDDTLEAQVVEAEERLRQAMLHNDVQALGELMADKLLFTGHHGQIASKADDLAAHRARLLQVTQIEPSERQILLRANFAVVSVKMHLVGSYAGEPIDQSMRYTRVWAPGPDGRLQIIAGHMGEVQQR
jgi:ketosteroid isomerase-like protein